jgi:diguanylate cyclase (GGDEF)-like protein
VLAGDFLPFPLDRALAEESPLLGATISVFDPLGTLALIAADARAPSVSDPGAIARLSGEALGSIREYRNAKGEQVIGCAVPLGLFNWSIAVEVPFDVAYEPVMSAAARMLAIGLCIVLTFSFVAYRITTVMLRPIEVLSDGAQLIANGVIDHEIDETGTDDEIGVLARSFNQMMRNLRRDRREIEQAHEELMERNLDLQRANEILNQLSITDGLTKIHNHRFFQDHLTREIKRVNRLNESLAIILLDVDDFKGLNDRFGHAAGDEVLMRLARIMESSVRETDLLARYGGEEFVIVASNTDRLGAYQLAEKIRINVEDASFTIGETLRKVRVTVSIGVAEYEGNRKKFFLAADRALYDAKAEGKNCVIIDSPTP